MMTDYPTCRPYLDESLLSELGAFVIQDLPARLRTFADAGRCPGFLSDLARVEDAARNIRDDNLPHQPVTVLQVNPCLELLEVSWRSLLPLLSGAKEEPAAGNEHLLFWKNPDSGDCFQDVATNSDLLALKLVVDEVDPLAAAAEIGCPVGAIDRLLERAVRKGLLLRPDSDLCRTAADFPISPEAQVRHTRADAFTLQWHITHRCDLHCRHCYDRSERDDVSLDQGVAILDQMRDFCRAHYVDGQVSFSGGNPFLHPDFFNLYRAARQRNLGAAILGNPVSEQALERLLQIGRPVFYQVSLEGLQAHNDQIRGAGNFQAVIDFLGLLQQKKVYSMVMLTLTQANLDQVLPLAEFLRDRVDLFTYNRLAMVGEGASLESPRRDDYRRFVTEYLQARETNPVMALKDNLINIERDRQKQGLFGGCTGFGCGAAFNFVSLLPDGQVHACRKFPSPIGNMYQQGLQDVYTSPMAVAYRKGCQECRDCRIRLTCGGCLAVAHGYGFDPLLQKDPTCFMAPDGRAGTAET